MVQGWQHKPNVCDGVTNPSRVCYPTIAGKDRDEFPPKSVIQNTGTAHIQYMTPTDNCASGAFLGKLLTPYNDGDQIELIDALIGSPLNGALFCRDAYAQ